jgi:hypothetical protein
MPHRSLARGALFSVLAVLVASTTVSLRGQTHGESSKGWTPPRTPDGHADLQGVWANNTATPLERPVEFAGKPLLTDGELAVLKQRAARLFDGSGDAAFGDSVYRAVLGSNDRFKSTDGETGDYNQFWLPDREFEKRTSLITDPADGRLPPRAAEAQQRAAARAEAARGHSADGPESRSLSERCITFGVPRIQAAYMSYYRIVQNPEYVVIQMETIHDARVIPLDGRPPTGIPQYLGESRGHWEGDTLVVNTASFSPKSNFMGSSDKLRLTERFTRVAPNTLEYQFTVDDKTTWTRPWTAMIPLRHTDEQLFEYACHEGNYGIAGILAGARAEERSAAE